MSLPTKSTQPPRYLWLLLLILLSVFLRLPTLEVPFDNDSGAIAYHARLIVNGEPLYSTHHPAHHLPATYYLYALAFTLFGDVMISVKWLVLLWSVLVVLVIYFLGRQVAGEQVGLLGALFYSFMSSQVHMDGLTGQIELFANFPRVAGAFLIIWLIDHDDKRWLWSVVGALGLIAILFKAVYISVFALAGVVGLVLLWREWPNWQPTVGRVLWGGVGVTAVFLLLALYLTLTDTWEGFLYVFELGTNYVGANTQAEIGIPIWLAYPLLPVLGLSFNNPALVVVGIVGGIMVLWQARHNNMMVILSWFLFSFVVAGANLNLYTHYYLLIVPSLSLLAGWLIEQVWQKSPVHSRPFVVGGLVALVLGVGLWYEWPFYQQYFAYRAGDISLREAIEEGTSYSGASANIAQDIADYVQDHTEPNDLVYAWTSHMQLYYAAQRRSSAYIIWPIYMNSFPSEETVLGAQTRYVVIEQEHFPPPDWFQQQLAQMYEFEITIQKHDLYRYVGE